MRSKTLLALLGSALAVVAQDGDYLNLDLIGLPEPLDPANYQYYGYLRNLDSFSTTVDISCHDDKLMSSNGRPAAPTPDPACDPINSVALTYGNTGIEMLQTITGTPKGESSAMTATVRVSCHVSGSVEARCTAVRSGYTGSDFTTETASTRLVSPLPTRRVTLTGGLEFLSSALATASRTSSGIVAATGGTESLSHASASVIKPGTSSADVSPSGAASTSSAGGAVQNGGSPVSSAGGVSGNTGGTTLATATQASGTGTAPASNAATPNQKNAAGRGVADVAVTIMLVGASALVSALAFIL